MKNNKKSFLMSSISLLLCFIMLLGTTFAWFTDSVTSSGNKIQAGTLKLDLEMLNKETGAYESIKTSNDPIFNYNLWEPGYTDVKFLKVENEGSLSLKWKAMFVSDEEVSKLAEVIDVYVLPSVTELGYDNLTRDFDGWRRVGTLDQFINTLSETTYGNLLPYSCAYLGIALHMQESAGNEYQEIGLEAFDIQIVATQMSNEEDSFGPDYDNDAEWPASGMNFSATQSLAGVNIIYGELAEDVIIRHESGAYAIVPAGVKLADGVTELKFSGKGLDNEAGNFAEDSKNYDIHIEGIAADNTKSITVFIGKILDAGLGETELKLYHEDVQMTRVNSVDDFATYDQFTYDAATGAVVLYVKNFSVFSGVKTEADVWDGEAVANGFAFGTGTEADPYIIETSAQLVYFRNQVDAGVTYAGQFVKLEADIDLNNKPFDPIGFGYWYEKNVVEGVDKNTVFMGTFDGGNHTIYNLYENCWELDPDKTSYSTYTYSTAGAGLFASIKNATIKNLAISGAEIVFECVDMGIVVGYAQGTCHFENIVVTDSQIANYNRYTGGVVGEVSYGPYGIDKSLGYSHTFKNIVVDSTVTVSGLWGSFGCGMGGVIGGKWGNATVKMENVVSAPRMDVYNDVVSAYQWYAFRGCGMLIGHTEEPYSDGRNSGNATANFLTCENVNVYYGDWTNYTYYEFANQDSATGRSYPWVRAEAGEYCDAFSNIRYGVPTVGGVKVTADNADKLSSSNVSITFNQLYGADRGMYGTNKHDGVTIHNKLTKTIYIHNNANWENLTLHYWYVIGDEVWTTVPNGISFDDKMATGTSNVYKISVPIYAEGFKITADDDDKEKIFDLLVVANNGFYTLEGDHVHDFTNNNECICGCKKATVIISNYADINGWVNETLYADIKIVNDVVAKAIGGGNTGKYYTNGENWRLYSSNDAELEISSNSYNIISVVVNYKSDIDSDKTGKLLLGELHIKSGEIVEVNAHSITLVVENKVGVESIEVIYSSDSACTHPSTKEKSFAPTCTEPGYTASICVECGKAFEREEGEGATGHTDMVTDSDHNCDVCGAENVTEHVDTDGDTVCDNGCGVEILVQDGENTESGWIKTDLDGIKPTDIVVIVWTTNDGLGTSYAVSNDKGTSDAPDAVIVTIEDDKLTGNIGDNLKWNITYSDGKLTIYPNGSTTTWLYTTNSNNGVRVGTNTNKTFIVDSNNSYLKNTGTNRYLGVYTTNPDIRCYTNTTGNTANQILAFYKYVDGTTGGSGNEGGDTEHTHSYNEVVTAPTCTEGGYTTYTCSCGDTYTDNAVEATGHNYDVDGTCTVCGEKDPNSETNESVEATLSFASTANRVSQNTSKQVWSANGITFTNEKSLSTTDVANYSNPVRLYANSKVTVEAKGITKIVFDCNSNSYATALKNSIGNVTGATVTVSGDIVTVTFTNAVDTFTIVKLTAQVRLDSITVTLSN